MVKGGNLAFAFLGVLAALVLRSSAVASEKEPKLPAVEIVRAITESEDMAAEADETEEPLPVTGTPIEWDFYAMPESSRSWLFFSMPPEAFDKLEENLDEAGQPLFR